MTKRKPQPPTVRPLSPGDLGATVGGANEDVPALDFKLKNSGANKPG